MNDCGTSIPRSLENIICEGSFSGNLPEGRLYVIYISSDRELIIRNPELVGILNIYLNNLIGQQIDSYHNIATCDEIKIPVQQFTPGVYLFRIQLEDRILTKQVMLE